MVINAAKNHALFENNDHENFLLRISCIVVSYKKWILKY